MLLKQEVKRSQVDQLPLRMLAHIGDAVAILYERERAILKCATAKQMHSLVKQRVNAQAQANFLDKLNDRLDEKELDLVRRARNLKLSHHGPSSQSIYRKATAFEALIGYLYLVDESRLNELLQILDLAEIPDSNDEILKDRL